NWGATRDPDEIRRDFMRWQDALLGIPTGPDNGTFVVEIDSAKGHPKLGEIDGFASLRALIERHGDLPATLTAESPSGSRHYYFRWPADVVIRNSASEIAPGIDVRGKGGMVIGAPSRRPEGGEYRVVNDAPIAEAPPWLLTLAAFSGGTEGEAREPNPEPEA